MSSLVSIDSPGQLRRDARVHHEEYGFGIIRSRRPSSIEVDFGTGNLLRLPLAGDGISLVVE